MSKKADFIRAIIGGTAAAAAALCWRQNLVKH